MSSGLLVLLLQLLLLVHRLIRSKQREKQEEHREERPEENQPESPGHRADDVAVTAVPLQHLHRSHEHEDNRKQIDR